MQKLGEVTVDGKVLQVMGGNYGTADGPTAIVLADERGQTFAKISVNLEGESDGLKPGQFYAKTWSENEPLREQLLASGLFHDTGKRVEAGFASAELWQFGAPASVEEPEEEKEEE